MKQDTAMTPTADGLPPLPDGLNPPPDGFDYFGDGPLSGAECGVITHDVCFYSFDLRAWVMSGDGTASRMYSIRRGTELHAKNFGTPLPAEADPKYACPNCGRSAHPSGRCRAHRLAEPTSDPQPAPREWDKVTRDLVDILGSIIERSQFEDWSDEDFAELQKSDSWSCEDKEEALLVKMGKIAIAEYEKVKAAATPNQAHP